MRTIKALLILVFLSGCITIYNPATGKNEHYIISEESEIKWGNAVASQFLETNKISEDKRLISYVDKVGQKVAGNSHRSNLDYHFYVIDEDVMNAFAVFGGHIFVYKGLLDKVNEDELAFVLSHEVAHICARHGLKRLQASLGFTILAGILLRSPDLASTQRIAGELFNIVSLGYSRKDELQSDSLGLEYLVKSGYDTSAAVSLFEKLEQESKDAGYVPFYLRSHPYPQQRIKSIEEEIEKINSPEGADSVQE